GGASDVSSTKPDGHMNRPDGNRTADGSIDSPDSSGGGSSGGGSEDSSTGSNDSATVGNIMTSCVGKTDGSATASNEICCKGWPIPATANGECPVLFNRS